MMQSSTAYFKLTESAAFRKMINEHLIYQVTGKVTCHSIRSLR